jgi:ribosomal protein S18 acetylase RimI-like enzyme
MPCVLPARPDELPIVVGILDQAARWMLSRGIQQWDSPCPPEVWQRMAREIENGQVYLARLSEPGEPVGTLRLEWRGVPLWPAEADAGYIHSMAVSPAYMGRQVGKQMLEWAIQHIRSRGKSIARLDCMSNNPRLRAYYESAGFLYRGDGLSGAYRLALYELAL